MENTEHDEQTEPQDPVLPPPADFDLDAWMTGLRPTVRSATIYQRGDLLAEIEETERLLSLAEAEDAEEYGIEQAAGSQEALNERLEDLYRTLLHSGVTFRVEARSNDWLNDVFNSVTQASEGRSLSKDERLAVANKRQLAGAIIEPAGVTYEHLDRLEKVSGSQYRKLLGAMFAANAQAPTVTAPTSPSSSARRGGRGRR